MTESLREEEAIGIYSRGARENAEGSLRCCADAAHGRRMMMMTTTIRCERCKSVCISALLCAFRACVCMCVIKFIRISMVIVCLQVTSRARFFYIICSSVHVRHQSIHGNAYRSFSSSYHQCHHHYRKYRCNTMLLPSTTTRETCTSSRFSSRSLNPMETAFSL